MTCGSLVGGRVRKSTCVGGRVVALVRLLKVGFCGGALWRHSFASQGGDRRLNGARAS